PLCLLRSTRVHDTTHFRSNHSARSKLPMLADRFRRRVADAALRQQNDSACPRLTPTRSALKSTAAELRLRYAAQSWLQRIAGHRSRSSHVRFARRRCEDNARPVCAIDSAPADDSDLTPLGGLVE